MANQQETIKKLEGEVLHFQNTLTKYREMFSRDGSISPIENKHLTDVGIIIGKITARLNAAKAKLGIVTPTPSPTPQEDGPENPLSDNPTAQTGKGHENAYVYKDVTQQHYNKITELYKTGKVGSVDQNSDVHWNDVAQGQIGDCYFMSAIGAVAKADPGLLKKLIKGPFKDGSYEVTLHIKDAEKFDWRAERKPQKVTVSAEFLVDGYGNPAYAQGGDTELWVMLLEKAYAILRKDQIQKGGYVDKLGDGYDKLEGGWGEEGIEVLTGKEASAVYTSSLSIQALSTKISSALRERRPITTATIHGPAEGVKANKTQIEAQNRKLVLGHEYFIIAFDGSKITVQNPWNNEVTNGDGGGDLTFSINDYVKYFEVLSCQDK